MRTLVVHDDASGAAAKRLAAAHAEASVLPAVLRDSDLATRPDADLSAEQLAELRRLSEAILEQVGETLPEALTRRGANGSPSAWDCYREYFRSWSIGPLVSNRALMAQAVEQTQAGVVQVVENPRRAGWWSYRQQAFEAAQAATAGTSVVLRGSPGPAARGLRQAAALLGGAWAAGMAQNRVHGAGAPRPAEGSADVLFVSVGPTCPPIIRRVSQRLLDHHGLSSACVMLEEGEIAPSDPGVTRYVHVDAFRAQARPWRQGLAVGLSWPGWWRHACRSGARSVPGQLWPALRNRLLVALARDLQATFTDRVATRLMLDALRPRVIVGLHLHWARLAPIVLSAQAEGAAAVYLQHGIYLPKDDFSAVLPYDELMVFGEAAAQSVRARVTDRPVTAVGHCLYDDIEPVRAGTRATGPVVVATQPDEPHLSDMAAPDWWLRLVAAECRTQGVAVIAKLHPREVDPEPYLRLTHEYPETVTIAPPSANLRQLLADARAMVTRDSTVVIEAGLLGVPAVTVNLTGWLDRFPFAQDGGALAIREASQVGTVIRHVLATGAPELAASRAEFLARHAGPTDGQAAARVSDTIARWAAPRF